MSQASANAQEGTTAAAKAVESAPQRGSIVPRDNALAATLGKTDFKRVADARREVWNGGFAGMVLGASAGLLVETFVRRVLRPSWWQSKHRWMTVMCSFAAGAFVGSSLTGRTALAAAGEVYRRHVQPAGYEAKRHAAAVSAAEQDAAAADALLQRLRAREAAAARTAASGVRGPTDAVIGAEPQYQADPFDTSSSSAKRNR